MEQARSTQRPITVIAFEVLGLVVTALPLVLDPIDLIAFNLVLSVGGAAFILWITRGQSWLGRTIYTILTAIGVCFFIAEQFSYPDLFSLLLILSVQAILMGLAWSPPTSRWLDAKDTRA